LAGKALKAIRGDRVGPGKIVSRASRAPERGAGDLGSGERAPPAAGIRVLIVDDHPLFRRGLREHLEGNGFEVVGEAEDVDEAEALANEAAPNVILLDGGMPGGSAVDATMRLQLASAGGEVLLMTLAPEPGPVVDAIRAGASGCLLKDSDGEQILAGIAAAIAGQSVLSRPIATALIDRLRAREPPPVSGVNERATLTEREGEVLRLIVEGKDNKQIAAELVISPQTVKTHVSTVLDKLEAGNRVQAAVKAVRAGWV
jgi:DNA-binding NarL/FixJ family response regulator